MGREGRGDKMREAERTDGAMQRGSERGEREVGKERVGKREKWGGGRGRDRFFARAGGRGQGSGDRGSAGSGAAKPCGAIGEPSLWGHCGTACLVEPLWSHDNLKKTMLTPAATS